MSTPTTSRVIECLLEAVKAHGNTDLTRAWYKRWMPLYYAKWGLPTTVQYSLSCFLMDHAAKLIECDFQEWS